MSGDMETQGDNSTANSIPFPTQSSQMANELNAQPTTNRSRLHLDTLEALMYDHAHNYFMNLSHSQSTKYHLEPFQENSSMINPNYHGNMAVEYHLEPLTQVPFSKDGWIQSEGKCHKSLPKPEMHHDASISNSINIMQSFEPSIDHKTNVEDQVQASSAFVTKLGNDVGCSSPHVESSEKEMSSIRRRNTKQTMKLTIHGIEIKTPQIPIPVCSCTGKPQKCSRYGANGWQSACCNANISKYPLPSNTKGRETRIVGRRMSKMTFKLVLEQVISEGHNLSNLIDLKTHWAKHGTNRHRAIKRCESPAAHMVFSTSRP